MRWKMGAFVFCLLAFTFAGNFIYSDAVVCIKCNFFKIPMQTRNQWFFRTSSRQQFRLGLQRQLVLWTEHLLDCLSVVKHPLLDYSDYIMQSSIINHILFFQFCFFWEHRLIQTMVLVMESCLIHFPLFQCRFGINDINLLNIWSLSSSSSLISYIKLASVLVFSTL